MGESGHGVGSHTGNEIPEASVTGVGGPVLLAATAPELARGDVLAGRYQIEALIGTGGSGQVLRAFDRVARSAVALKILRAEYASDPVWTERFSRELRVGRQIQHRNVCRIFDIGEAEGHRFLSMELATRGTVRGQLGEAALERPLDHRITDSRAVVEGVAALHAAGIVHRDVKPENLLRMEDGRLVVSDFGLATDPGAGPATTIMVGTPRYMAPEVVMGDTATSRSDVWALGIVIHEILFGVRPDRSQVRRGVRRYTPPAVTSLKERRLAELCGRCSDDDPRARPASAVEVRREFDAAALGRPSRRTTNSRQMVWGAVAIITLAGLGIARDRWTSSAVASSSQIAGSISTRVPRRVGTATDWSRDAQKVASFSGQVHCLSLDEAKKTARVIWGQPRKAQDVEIASGLTTSAAILPDTYEVGCPTTSPDGRGLLFEKNVEGASQIFFSSSPSGQDPRFLTLGSAPVWLPNGQEFAFSLDSRHAAIFSISTRQMSVVADDLSVASTLEDKVVDAMGTRLALLYTYEGMESVVVVRALPALHVVGRMSVPSWARNLRFSASGKILFTAFGATGKRQLVSAEVGGGTLVNVGEVPGADFQNLVTGGDAALITAKKRQMDLWRVEGVRKSRLTWDGQSSFGSLSVTGQLAIQRMLPDGRDVVVLRDKNGRESQVTTGPTDVNPAFLPNGRAWIFSRVNTGQIFECAVTTNHCALVHTDSLRPVFPTPDPSGQWIAYVTALNNTRVRLVSRATRTERDLGPALLCRPLWSSPERLWVVVSENAKGRTWAEFDIVNERLTGKVRLATDPVVCSPPEDFGAHGDSRVTSVWEDTTELFSISTQQQR